MASKVLLLALQDARDGSGEALAWLFHQRGGQLWGMVSGVSPDRLSAKRFYSLPAQVSRRQGWTAFRYYEEANGKDKEIREVKVSPKDFPANGSGAEEYRTIGACIPKEIYDAIEKLAEELGTTKSAIIRDFLVGVFSPRPSWDNLAHVLGWMAGHDGEEL